MLHEEVLKLVQIVCKFIHTSLYPSFAITYIIKHYNARNDFYNTANKIFGNLFGMYSAFEKAEKVFRFGIEVIIN